MSEEIELHKNAILNSSAQHVKSDFNLLQKSQAVGFQCVEEFEKKCETRFQARLLILVSDGLPYNFTLGYTRRKWNGDVSTNFAKKAKTAIQTFAVRNSRHSNRIPWL